VGMIALQLMFSLAGVPFDPRLVPLRTDVRSRTDSANRGAVLLWVLHTHANAVSNDFLHLGCIMLDTVPAGSDWYCYPVFG
jgi:hypothetical protein